MELFGKLDKWRQIYKQTSLYIKRCVEKKKLLVRHNKVAK